MTLAKRTVSAVKVNAILAGRVCHSVSLMLNHGAQAFGTNCSYLRVLQDCLYRNPSYLIRCMSNLDEVMFHKGRLS